MNEPVISVSLPVYNAEKFLAQALDSVLAQTFHDFELLILVMQKTFLSLIMDSLEGQNNG
jgi:GT2 family glycosyltransferase